MGAVEEFIENDELFFDKESESPNDWQRFVDALSDFEPQAQQSPETVHAIRVGLKLWEVDPDRLFSRMAAMERERG